jgi:hypothetical protein
MRCRRRHETTPGAGRACTTVAVSHFFPPLPAPQSQGELRELTFTYVDLRPRTLTSEIMRRKYMHDRGARRPGRAAGLAAGTDTGNAAHVGETGVGTGASARGARVWGSHSIAARRRNDAGREGLPRRAAAGATLRRDSGRLLLNAPTPSPPPHPSCAERPPCRRPAPSA